MHPTKLSIPQTSAFRARRAVQRYMERTRINTLISFRNYFVGVIVVVALSACIFENRCWENNDIRDSLYFFSKATPKDIHNCLSDGASLDVQDEAGWTPLHLAAIVNKSPAAAKALLIGEPDLNSRDNRGNTSLHAATGSIWSIPHLTVGIRDSDNHGIVRLLLDAGANPSARNKGGDTPLHGAAFNKNFAMVEALLAAGANPSAMNGRGQTPLHLAAQANESSLVVEALLIEGADPNAQDYIDWTPLHVSAWKNKNPAVIEALLAAGADPNAKTAKSNDNYTTISAQNKHGETPLHIAVKANESLAIISALLRARANPNARDKHGNTPLHWAAGKWNANPVVVEALLAAGADPNAANDISGATPLHRAAGVSDPRFIRVKSNENPRVLEALLAAGANLEARDKNGRTPTHLAAWGSKNPEIVEVLLAAGADLKAKDKEGRIPWDLAKNREQLQGTEVYWHLNEGRF